MAFWRCHSETLVLEFLLSSDVLLQDNSQMERCEGLGGANDALNIPSLYYLLL